MTELHTCRVCLSENEQRDMISPCACIGTNKYIHRKCLNEWVTHSTRRDASTMCPNCLQKYEFQKPTLCERITEKSKAVFSCLYSFHTFLAIGITLVDLNVIPIITGAILPTSFEESLIYNSASFQNNPDLVSVYYFSFYSAVTICVVPISLACLTWELSGGDNGETCCKYMVTRTGVHTALYIMFGSSLFLGSICHGIMLSRWFQHLKATSSNLWCWKKSSRRILDLNPDDGHPEIEVEVQVETNEGTARIE
jgi:hypothetical protein